MFELEINRCYLCKNGIQILVLGREQDVPIIHVGLNFYNLYINFLPIWEETLVDDIIEAGNIGESNKEAYEYGLNQWRYFDEKTRDYFTIPLKGIIQAACTLISYDNSRFYYDGKFILPAILPTNRGLIEEKVYNGELYKKADLN